MLSNVVRLLIAAALIIPTARSLELPEHLGAFLLYSALILVVTFSASLFRRRHA
ncbi:hypothetical protein [Actinokineospora sp. UTMC 2448]|uniref:hypothetical protein n=1 Tax=Actinokineospora sp. UTMC 2448 TaxID=2268449 RepID=UPI0021645F7B|nr:hypothetical protein [Actinokineospora sp. UTMC 2448]UVS78377.1 hypothetical protein Actkin_02110 [Actinokineospora sp. UTMC 2448]